MLRWISYILLLSLIPSGSNWKLWLHYCCGELEEVQLFEEFQAKTDDCCDFLCINNCCDQLLLEIPAMLDEARSDFKELSLKKLIDSMVPKAVIDQTLLAEQNLSSSVEYFKPIHPPSAAGVQKRLRCCSLVFYG